MLIYKIFRDNEWQTLQAAGITQGAPIDVADGFIHFSTAQQVAETAAKHFADEDALILAACGAERFGDALKWELSRGGAKFPHLYRPLNRDDIEWFRPLPLIAGRHQFPDDLQCD